MYNNCSEIPIYNFFEIVKTRNLELLMQDGESMDDYKEEQLFNILMNIMDEYNELTKNNKLMQEKRARLDIEYLEAKYFISKELISMWNEHKAIEILHTLNRFDWKIDLEEEITPQLDKILKDLIGIKNKLKIKKANFVKKFRKNADKEDSTPNFDVEEACINLEIGLPLSYKIDVHKDSIKRFVIWNNALQEKNKALTRSHG